MNTDIESRIRRLERQNRFLIGCLASGVALALFTAAAKDAPKTPEVLHAKRFSLVNEDGKEIAFLANEAGYPALVYPNRRYPNEIAMRLFQSVNGVHLAMRPSGPRDTGGVDLSQDSASGTLQLWGGYDGQRESSVFLTAKRMANLVFQGRTDTVMSLDPSRPLPLSINDAKGKPFFTVKAEGLDLFGPKLNLRDPSGKLLQQLPAPSDK